MKKLKVVQVGCGGISAAWLGAMKERKDAEYIGLVDLNREAAEKRAADHGLTGVEIGTDLDAMLTRTRPDVVFDCTLPETHVKVTTLALRHGCHVLGEKPMADTMPNARRMMTAARKAGRTYAVMQNRRYMSTMVALRRFLERGVIGRMTTVYCDFLLAAHFGGFRDRMAHPLVLDMAIHTFDQARFLCGQDARAVLAHEWNPPGSWYRGDASAIAIFEMTRDVVFNYRGSWCSEGLNTRWESIWRIIGERGSVTWDGAETFHAQVIKGNSGFTRPVKEVKVPYDPACVKHAGHDGCIDEFIRAVLAGRKPQTVCTDNIKSLAMVHAVIASAACGRRVECR
jgi:predicted dehydrogenase